MNHPIVRTIIRYFLQGLILITPVAITVYIIVQSFFILDELLPFDLFPGAGIIIIFTLVTFLGFAGNTIVGKPIKALFKELLNRTPVVKSIYTTISDLFTSILGQKKKFTEPVLVKLSTESNLERLGFVTQTDLHELGISSQKVAVYLPHSYNFSGNLFVVNEKNITPLNAKSAEVMKFIVSGGVTTLAEARREIKENEETL